MSEGVEENSSPTGGAVIAKDGISWKFFKNLGNEQKSIYKDVVTGISTRAREYTI